MKKLSLIALGILALLTSFQPLHAQTSSGDDIETYLKTNVAVTNFSILGVTKKQYAKCLKTQNYFEPEKKVKQVLIGKTLFTDDGKGYDLTADDGILTSNELFPYTTNVYLPGTYIEGPDYNTVVADEIFAHRNQLAELTIKIGCKMKWVKCREMPYPHNILCDALGWPHGGFELVECQFEIQF